jgi:hypothetical protein
MKSISKLLRRAANKHLWDGKHSEVWTKDSEVTDGKEPYTCDSIYRAAMANRSDWATYYAAMDFLRGLGCPTDSLRAFHEFTFGEERQGARYAWLMFAAAVAEEQNL